MCIRDRAVSQQRRKLADVEVYAHGRDYRVGAEGEDKDHDRVDAKLHQRPVEGEDALGAGEVGADVLGRAAELLRLVVLAHEGLYHAHGLDVLLDGLVELVVLPEDAPEERHGLERHQRQAHAQHGQHEEEDPGHLAAHDEGHDKGKDEHER